MSKQAHPSHGLATWVSTKRTPKLKGMQAIRKELLQLQRELVEKHGGDKATPEARILIASIIEAVGVQAITGAYVRQYGLIDAQAAAQGKIELSPVLGKNWISFANVARLGVMALNELGRKRGPEGTGMLDAIIAEYAEAGPDPKPGSPGSTPATEAEPASGGEEGDDHGQD